MASKVLFANSLVLAIILNTRYSTQACYTRCSPQEPPWIRTQKPPSGIANCLIPPFEDLVYNLEGPVVGRPEMRTGCYVKANLSGSPLPDMFFPISSAKPLEYYVIDATGRKHTTTETSALELQVTTLEKTETRKFSFEQLCFPMPCYASVTKQEKACYKSFPYTCEAALNICKDKDVEKIQWELSQVTNLGRSSSNYDEWVYCKSKDDQPAVPIMTPEFPFGRLDKLSRIPIYSDHPGPRIKISIEYLGPIGTIACGCEVIFPLKAPYDSYMFRFYFWNRLTGKTSISEGQTGIVERVINVMDCLEWQQIGYTQKCVKEGRLYENFTFYDFCFPKECYIDYEKPPQCTGKAGTHDRELKEYNIMYFADEHMKDGNVVIANRLKWKTPLQL